MNTKEIEKKGMEELISYLGERFFKIIIETKETKPFGIDLIAEKNGKKYYIELKASNKFPDSNIRIAHQTVSLMLKHDKLNDMIVACVYNLSKKNADFMFFRFGDLENVFIEPHFVVQHKKEKHISKNIECVLKSNRSFNIKDRINSPVFKYMKHLD